MATTGAHGSMPFMDEAIFTDDDYTSTNALDFMNQTIVEVVGPPWGGGKVMK